MNRSTAEGTSCEPGYPCRLCVTGYKAQRARKGLDRTRVLEGDRAFKGRRGGASRFAHSAGIVDDTRARGARTRCAVVDAVVALEIEGRASEIDDGGTIIHAELPIEPLDGAGILEGMCIAQDLGRCATEVESGTGSNAGGACATKSAAGPVEAAVDQQRTVDVQGRDAGKLALKLNRAVRSSSPDVEGTGTGDGEGGAVDELEATGGRGASEEEGSVLSDGESDRPSGRASIDA